VRRVDSNGNDNSEEVLNSCGGSNLLPTRVLEPSLFYLLQLGQARAWFCRVCTFFPGFSRDADSCKNSITIGFFSYWGGAEWVITVHTHIHTYTQMHVEGHSAPLAFVFFFF
jgi:hypothetical protein